MRSWWNQDRRFGAAIAASLCIHALLALLFPSQTSTGEPSAAVETISFQKIQRVSVVAPKVARVARTVVAIAKPAAAPRKVQPRSARPNPKAPALRPNRHAKTMPTPGARTVSTVFALGARTGTPAPPRVAHPAANVQSVASARPSATPAAQQQQVAANQGTNDRGGTAPFLSEQPPALAKDARDELRRRFKMNVTLTIVVDEAGNTKQITFDPPVSAELEKQIRDVLAQAHWDPAICGGGIYCEGTASIKLFQ